MTTTSWIGVAARYACASLMLALCACDDTSDTSRDQMIPWQEELLLQLDEVRQKNLALESDVMAIKAQLATPVAAHADDKAINVPFRAPDILGNKTAKIAILEFSDYECPFCARHALNVLPKIKT